MIGAGLFAIVAGSSLTGCSSAPKPVYEYNEADPLVTECVMSCDQDRTDCYGVLARVFQRCVARNPGSALDQQRCLDREQPRAIANMDINIAEGSKNCEQRYDACFVACGGRITQPDTAEPSE